MFKYIGCLLLSIGFLKSYAGDIQYPVSAIAPALLKGADVVKRMEEVRFEIIKTNKTVEHYTYAITILNENGDYAAAFSKYYDALTRIDNIEGALYDAEGKLIKRLKSKDITDRSAVSNISLMEDNRVKTHHFYHKVYPYTVLYESTVVNNNSFFFPNWVPQNAEDMAVEKSIYTLTCPEAYNVRYRMFNYKGAPTITTEKNKKVHQWQIANLPAIKRSFASPVWKDLTTVVYFAPSDFEIEGYKGVMNSWQEIGKFQIALNKGRDVLPENIIQKVQSLTAGVNDDKEKIKILYNYLQQNTRYISIQLGLGGWQPFDAAYVSKNGYGDCKALSNYMYSLLKTAGIRSHYTIIRAGESKDDRRMLEDFPSKQSNHIVLCVPLQKDTMWLECTSQTDPAGYMGGFTGNRKALLITENGGVVVSTPRYGMKENIQSRKVNGVIDTEGNLQAKVKTGYRAMQGDDLHAMLTYKAKDEIKKSLNERFHLATYTINNFSYKETKEAVPVIEEELDIDASNYATISGKRLFITPNVLSRNRFKLNTDEKRIYPFVFDDEYRDVDTVVIQLPKGYVTEAMPQDVTLKTKYGLFQTSLQLKGNEILYIRTQEQYAGTFAATEAEEIAKYYEAMYKADHSRMVLIKKE